MTAATAPYHVHMLDPMPETEVTFAQSLLPETEFTVTAPAPDASAPSPELLPPPMPSLPAPSQSRRRSLPQVLT